MFDEIDDLHRGADLKATVGRTVHIGIERILDVHNAIRLLDVVLHPCKKIHTAGKGQRDSTSLQRCNRIFFICWINVGEGLHDNPPVLCCSTTSRTFCGDTTSLRIVSQFALRTAHPIASALDTVGGCPIPLTPIACSSL